MFSFVLYKTEMTEIILQEKILISSFQCALAVPTRWIVSAAPVECLLDGCCLYGEFSRSSAAAGIQGHTATRYRGKITQIRPMTSVYCRHCIQEKLLHPLKNVSFWHLLEKKKNSQDFVVWSLFKSLHDETEQQFLSSSAALPCISPLPCSPCQQFCTACRAFARAQHLLINVALFLFGLFLLRDRNQTIKLEKSNLFSF